MANGFGSFFVGSSGLMNAQNALNVTANNLANVNTAGYVREQVRFADKSYNTRNQAQIGINMEQSGLGVTIGDVAHARDIFLDKAFRQESGRKEFYETCYEISSYVEDMLQELDGEQFSQSISDLWQAVQELAKDPADSTNQNLVLEKAELLVSRSSTLYSDLKSYQSNLNEQINDKVKRINEIGDRIYEINLQVQCIEAGDVETAMTLRDERDLLIDELSGIVKTEIYEDSTGFVFVDVEGAHFIEEAQCFHMDVEKANGTGFYTPYWPYSSNLPANSYTPVFDLNADINSEYNNDLGSLKSLLLGRGDWYGKYYDMDDANYANIQDKTVIETEAEIDYLVRNIVTAINDVFCPNIRAGEALELDDDGTTMTVWDEEGNEYTIDADTLILDEESAAVGSDGELPPQELFKRVGCDRYTKVSDGDKTYYLYNTENSPDSSYWYAIGSITVNPELSKVITKMPAYTQNGAVDYSLGDKLSDVWEATNMRLSPNDTQPCNFQNYYNKIIGRLGTSGSIYKTATDTLTNTVSSIDNQRQQIMGVSSDEELTNMVKFQSAYNAASRYITVISEMTELIVSLI